GGPVASGLTRRRLAGANLAGPRLAGTCLAGTCLADTCLAGPRLARGGFAPSRLAMRLAALRCLSTCCCGGHSATSRSVCFRTSDYRRSQNCADGVFVPDLPAFPRLNCILPATRRARQAAE